MGLIKGELSVQGDWGRKVSMIALEMLIVAVSIFVISLADEIVIFVLGPMALGIIQGSVNKSRPIWVGATINSASLVFLFIFAHLATSEQRDFWDVFGRIRVEDYATLFGIILMMVCMNIVGRNIIFSKTDGVSFSSENLRSQNEKSASHSSQSDAFEHKEAVERESIFEKLSLGRRKRLSFKAGKRTNQRPVDHEERIKIIKGYIHAFQPLLVFIAAIVGAVLTFLGSKP